MPPSVLAGICVSCLALWYASSKARVRVLEHESKGHGSFKADHDKASEAASWQAGAAAATCLAAACLLAAPSYSSLRTC